VAVQAALGHRGPLDDEIDADGADAVLVEQLGGDAEDALAHVCGFRWNGSGGRHGIQGGVCVDTIQTILYRSKNRQVCLVSKG
jgi:hypothetical protein